ncbi:hypothetical protein LARI1_G009517 [Lachnellula arida]|uniref:Death domain-containing protein n=1 Tax=Lachnellula arida TaxID=1316785 RepID=A0A8T9AYT6_9HELO|nr:hypothetical protein LARI1_G009517 [Lachnellula arida]
MPVVRSKKTQNRLKLFERVLHLKCRVATDSARCAECIKAGGNTKCDVLGPSIADWNALERAESSIEEELREAQLEQQRMFDRLAAQQAKLLRLNKQREMFRQRAAAMLRRGLKSLDELDAVEEAERLAAEPAQPECEASASTNPAAPPDPFGPDFFFGPGDPALADALASYDPSDPYWQGVGLGTLQNSQGP